MCSRTNPREAAGVLEAEIKSQPLRSVENQIPQQELASGKQPQTEEKATTKTSTAKMNSNCAMTTNLKIRSEPFTDNYTVEKEIGRYVMNTIAFYFI